MSSSSLSVRAPSMGLRARTAAIAGEVQLDGGIIAMFVASRFLLIVAAVVAETLIIRNPALVPGDSAPILTSLTSWDGFYYLGIVREGYHVDPVAGDYRDTAFAPLYPLIVGVLSAPWPAFSGLIAVIFSNVTFLAAS